MQPIPETVAAVHELDDAADVDLLPQLVRVSNRVRLVVPECVGMSLSIIDHGVTFTLVATDEEIAALDAVQYADGGPCVHAIQHGEVIRAENDAMDEAGWQLFADATAARGVASTLSMPLLNAERVVGGVNLYAATPHAFEHRHQAVAEVVGAWADGAVTNADLSFSTRDTARRAPQVLRRSSVLEVATGFVSVRLGIGVAEARQRLEASAARAGVPVEAVARLVVEALETRDAGSGRGQVDPHVAQDPGEQP